jgi:hypothetical protein
MGRRGIRHTLQLAGITILALACMFYPFVPGTHDRLAAGLSAMAQGLAITGLVMVPLGILWLVHEFANRRAQRRGSAPHANKDSWFALAAIVASVVVMAGVALAGAVAVGPSLAVAVFILWIYMIRRALASVRTMRLADHSRWNPAPLYLILVPCILVLARQLYLPSAVASARERAIAGSARFIDAIEGYRSVYGGYPASLASVHHDYDPPIVGVERYHYEPAGQAYNVFFELPTYPIGTQEFVMYNPLGEHTMMVHNQDLLESPAGQVAQERAFHARAARDTRVRGWKYFWFD